MFGNILNKHTQDKWLGKRVRSTAFHSLGYQLEGLREGVVISALTKVIVKFDDPTLPDMSWYYPYEAEFYHHDLVLLDAYVEYD